MPANVTLKVAKGKLDKPEFVFDERTSCIVGRHRECLLRVPDDDAHRYISRHHCLLDINPPDIRIRDFGSLNGTHVNGRAIGKRKKGQSRGEAVKQQYPEYDLKHGDEIKVGKTVFRVEVFVPVWCCECGNEIPGQQSSQEDDGLGFPVCAECQEKAAAAAIPSTATFSGRRCSVCGRDVAAEVGSNRRQGEYVCNRCQSDPLKLILHLLEEAKSGRKDLAAIDGYTIERELGRGGMGAVYLAHHERIREPVALKVMLPKVAADRRARNEFLRETENTRALRHPNVVEFRDAGCCEGAFFLTLEFCNGGSVDKLMRTEGGRLTIDQAAPIILQTLDGLHYGHRATIPRVKLKDGSYGRGKGLVHRDLSPQNIFLSGSGARRIAKVGDFGLAKSFDTAGLSGLTRTGIAAGKPLFMPRQQVLNYKFAKPEVDVWAAAASFYNMLTGNFPRQFRRDQDPWEAVLRGTAVPIRKRDRSIPKRLADVIDTALQDKPGIVFKSAASLKRALEDVL